MMVYSKLLLQSIYQTTRVVTFFEEFHLLAYLSLTTELTVRYLHILSCAGKIYVWGQRTECCSSTDVQIPQPLSGNHALNSQFVTDIQTGPDNVVALTNSGEVWTWGSNKDGQVILLEVFY